MSEGFVKGLLYICPSAPKLQIAIAAPTTHRREIALGSLAENALRLPIVCSLGVPLASRE